MNPTSLQKGRLKTEIAEKQKAKGNGENKYSACEVL